MIGLVRTSHEASALSAYKNSQQEEEASRFGFEFAEITRIVRRDVPGGSSIFVPRRNRKGLSLESEPLLFQLWPQYKSSHLIEETDYIILLNPATARYDAQKGAVVIPDQTPVPAKPVAILNSEAMILATLIYVLFHDWIRANLISDYRVRLLFRFRESDQALRMFFRTFFASNGFNLLYWILLGLCVGLFVRVRNAGDRVLLVFALFPFVFVFYFCCYTGNIPATIMGTDTGRLLLPLQAYALPVFLVAWNIHQQEDAS